MGMLLIVTQTPKLSRPWDRSERSRPLNDVDLGIEIRWFSLSRSIIGASCVAPPPFMMLQSTILANDPKPQHTNQTLNLNGSVQSGSIKVLQYSAD